MAPRHVPGRRTGKSGAEHPMSPSAETGARRISGIPRGGREGARGHRSVASAERLSLLTNRQQRAVASRRDQRTPPRVRETPRPGSRRCGDTSRAGSRAWFAAGPVVCGAAAQAARPAGAAQIVS